MMTDQRYCLKCGADWQDIPIPEKDRKWHGYATYFSRRIGLYHLKQDCVTGWQCPDCEDIVGYDPTEDNRNISWQ